MYKHVVIRIHVPVFFGHLQGGIQQRKIEQGLVMSQMCNNNVMIHTRQDR